jgi:hypothetical protein
MAAITGTVAWMQVRGDVGLVLKINGVDFSNAAKGDWTAQAFKVHGGFVVANKVVHHPARVYPCDEPGSFCGGYALLQSVAVLDALYADAVFLGFSRKAGGLDITLPLATRPEDATNPHEYASFASCLRSILERAKAKVGTSP